MPMLNSSDKADSPSACDALTQFKERQMAYLADLLERKWACEITGHTVCVPTVDGYHCQLAGADLAGWLEALCLGDATTEQPPDDIFNCKIDHHQLKLKHGSTLSAVKIAPSRTRNIKLSTLAASASRRDRLQSLVSSYSSSGLFHVGFRAAKAIKWLGEKTLNMVDNVIIFKRTNSYIRWLDRWENEISTYSLSTRFEIGKEEQRTLFKILEEALEMSRPCYSSCVNACAVMIYSKLVAWANTTGTAPETTGPILTDEMAMWFAHLHSCLTPLHLAGIHRKDPLAGDLASELLDAVCAFPVAHQDPETASAVICILGTELAFSPYCSQHRRLGQALARILQLVLQYRPLKGNEMNGDEASSSTRPWEVVIFELCGTQDPLFAGAVEGPRGLSSILVALKAILSKPVIREKDEWLHLCDILQILCALSSRCTADIASVSGIIPMLLKALRADIPKQWLIIQDRSIHIIQRVVHYKPHFLHELIRLDGATAIARFASASPLRGATRSRKRIRNVATQEANRLLHEMRKQ